MAVYSGNGSSNSHHTQTPKVSPKALRLTRIRGKRVVPFSKLKRGDDTHSVEEFVSAVARKESAHYYGSVTPVQTTEANVLEEKSMADVIRKASNDCSQCHEAIAGSSPRHVRITLHLSSVGAETDSCAVQSICESCFGGARHETAAASNDDWKRNLKPMQRAAWDRREAGETQTVIAANLRVSQGEVSKLLQAAGRIRDAYGAHTAA